MEYDLEQYFYEDEDYPNKAKFCNNSGEYTIEEVGADTNGKMMYKFAKLTPYEPTKEEVSRQEIFELTNWFDNYFDKQLTQSQWQEDFTVSSDPYFKDNNGNPKTYTTIDDLKKQAKVVRDKIRRLKNIN